MCRLDEHDDYRSSYYEQVRRHKQAGYIPETVTIPAAFEKARRAQMDYAGLRPIPRPQTQSDPVDAAKLLSALFDRHLDVDIDHVKLRQFIYDEWRALRVTAHIIHEAGDPRAEEREKELDKEYGPRHQPVGGA